MLFLLASRRPSWLPFPALISRACMLFHNLVCDLFSGFMSVRRTKLVSVRHWIRNSVSCVHTGNANVADTPWGVCTPGRAWWRQGRRHLAPRLHAPPPLPHLRLPQRNARQVGPVVERISRLVNLAEQAVRQALQLGALPGVLAAHGGNLRLQPVAHRRQQQEHADEALLPVKNMLASVSTASRRFAQIDGPQGKCLQRPAHVGGWVGGWVGGVRRPASVWHLLRRGLLLRLLPCQVLPLCPSIWLR